MFFMMNSLKVTLILQLGLICLSIQGVHLIGTWMSLGLQSSRAVHHEAYLIGATYPLCQQIGGLTNGQKKLCMLYTDHMLHVGRGARRGISECQFQFRDKKWNCSTVEDSTVFGPILSIPSREAAFANAIASAGVVHSISRGCRDGQLTSCGCSEANRPKDLKKEWIWGGCGDNIHYGYKFAKNFIDIREREENAKRGSLSHGRQLMNIHNNEAGRRAVIKNMKVTCKCHGVSGSCSLVTCWQQLAPFRKIGDYLQQQYSGSTRVKITKSGRLKVKSSKSAKRIPTANDLVFLKRSPNYCQANDTIGSLGTTGRTCDSPSAAAGGVTSPLTSSLLPSDYGRSNSVDEENSCQDMCCGRGYETVQTRLKERCKCKFHWCCRVECETCYKDVQLKRCK